MVTEVDLAVVLHNGDRQLRKTELVAELMKRTNAGKSCCYASLKKHAAHLSEDGGLLKWTP